MRQMQLRVGRAQYTLYPARSLFPGLCAGLGAWALQAACLHPLLRPLLSPWPFLGPCLWWGSPCIFLRLGLPGPAGCLRWEGVSGCCGPRARALPGAGGDRAHLGSSLLVQIFRPPLKAAVGPRAESWGRVCSCRIPCHPLLSMTLK